MTGKHFLVLSLGPPLLIGGAYALSQPTSDRALAEFVPQTSVNLFPGPRRPPSLPTGDRDALEQACLRAAGDLMERLPPPCASIVRAPYVLAGDFSETQLDRLHREAVEPMAAALWRSYFDRRPDQPVVIVALSNETSYHDVARLLDGYEPTAYAGYTQRGRRRVVFNAATGLGTLTHELSHVLAVFDFPEMPEWFDEGLAALQEEAVFSSDGLMLAGKVNWRCRQVRAALEAGHLPEIGTVIERRNFRGEAENLNYATARSFCLYLQERGLLSHFYRKLRSAVKDDPSGLATVCELLGVDSVAELDRQFREWIATGRVAGSPETGG